MIRNYLRVALRNLAKYRALSAINIFGLSIGLACCILIFLFDQYELSYDRFYAQADRIYRATLRGVINNAILNGANTPAPMAAALVREMPEVENATRVINLGFPVIRYKDKVFSEERFFWSDSNFFQIFDLPFVEGNPRTALTQPNSVVISESMAKKYFGDEEPIGKILNSDKRLDYRVTGVVKNVPANSHFHFDFMATYAPRGDEQIWLSNNFYTYFLLREGAGFDGFQEKFTSMVNKYIGPQVKQFIGISFEQWMSSGGNQYTYVVEPMTSIHLQSHLPHEIEANGDSDYVYIFSFIAMAILLIACINFMNLSTARSERRAKEVGIRKTLGSNRSQLIGQFLAESVMMSAIAVGCALIFVEMALPFFNDLSGLDIRLKFFEPVYMMPLLIIFTLGVGIIAGSYPAFFLSSFQPVTALKSDSKGGNRKSFLRGTLVILQFAISIVLSIGTFIVYTQLNYIQNRKLGFDKEQVIIVNKTDDIGAHISAFKSALLRNTKVISASNSTSIPGSNFSDSAFKLEGSDGAQTRDFITLICDLDFLQTYQMDMSQGRFFSADFPSDSGAVVINETAAQALGLKEPLGKSLMDFNQPPNRYQIIGVVKNFNFESLHQPLRPLVIRLFQANGFGKYVAVKVAPGNYTETLSFLETTWRQFADNQAFEYNFFDQHMEHLYLAEQRSGKLISIFSALAILIACLGLLGLVAFVTEQRTKEIGIRKVMGASVGEIVFLLSKEFTKWVLIANILAWPLAYYGTTRWLQDFAYRIDVGVSPFILAGVLALLIALMTVSYQAIKAATANPVEALKYE